MSTFYEILEVSAPYRALMKRIQEANDCYPTGADCNIRNGAGPCSCSLEAQADVEAANG